jgi:hypothetical protein
MGLGIGLFVIKAEKYPNRTYKIYVKVGLFLQFFHDWVC